MNPRQKEYRSLEHPGMHRQRSGFTLIELLTVISIIGILASMVLFALFSVQETARGKRTKAQIAKIHELLSGRWESYRTRPLPIRLPPNVTPRRAAWIRLMALRELMRMEMPDRISDLAIGSVYHRYQDKTNSNMDIRSLNLPGMKSPLFTAYRRRMAKVLSSKWQNRILDYGAPGLPDPLKWSPQFEGSECLYMILATIQDGDTNGLDFFREHETGDVDGDRFPEILDGWGQPIDFIRWAPGFLGVAASTIQLGDQNLETDGDSGQGNGDAFDPLKVDPRWYDKKPLNDPFALFPLVYSMGADGAGGIATHGQISSDASKRFVGSGGDPAKDHFCITRHAAYPNDPFHHHGEDRIPLGSITVPKDFVDNISNHMLEAR
ncbi:MAG: type II secretion system protein [Pirellulaceae bacterium]|nr:type II secretion system protein [Pirellulaceae bacterium]